MRWLPLLLAAAGYQGKYEHDARLGDVDALVRHARGVVRTRLGLEAPEDVRVEILDARPEGAAKIEVFRGTPFSTSGYGGEVKIRVYAEFVANGWFDLGETLDHEMVHAAMRAGMERTEYGKVPKWLREGLAVWAAGQIDGKAVEIRMLRPQEKDPAWMAPGLEAGEHSLDRYPEYGLAIEFLEQHAGADAVRKLARALVDGTEPHQAVAEASGLPWDDFAAKARDHALARLRAVEIEGWDAFAAVDAAGRARKQEEAVELGTAFLKEHPKSPAVREVLYWTGKGLFLTERHDEAEKVLRELVEERVGGLMDDGLMRLGQTLAAQGKHKDAAEVFRKLLRDYPTFANADDVLYLLAKSLAAAGREDEASEVVGTFIRSFCDSNVADEIADLQADLD